MEEYERLLHMHVQMFCFVLSSSKVIYLFIYIFISVFISIHSFLQVCYEALQKLVDYDSLIKLEKSVVLLPPLTNNPRTTTVSEIAARQTALMHRHGILTP